MLGSFSGIANVAALIIVLAMVAVVLGNANTANDINALGSAFSGSIRAATLH